MPQLLTGLILFAQIVKALLPINLLKLHCDWIYRNRSKSHIGSYEMIDFKGFKAP